MNYLFIGAHTDDIELSCGGFIYKLLEQGHEVRCYTFSYCNKLSLLQEHTKSMDKLGVKTYIVNTYDNRTISYYRQKVLDDLIQFKSFYQPDVVVSHDSSDLHQDHQVVGQETLRAFKFTTILTYMAPWNGHLDVNYYVPLSRSAIDSKIEALSQYESQKYRPYMDENTIRTNSTYYSSQSPVYHWCEAFKVKAFYHEYQ
jgi:LmbE family N-acetylglucosaminyl deacetylase